MLLTIDVGNTHVVLGLYKGEEIYKYWRITTDKKKTSDEWAVIIEGLFSCSKITWKEISHVAVCSVVPDLTTEIYKMCLEYINVKPLVVTSELDTGIKIKLRHVDEIGADRIVNAVAVCEKYGGPAIVVDFGTATTFDALTANREYLGGAIVPGIGISIDALFSYAAKLPKVELSKPASIIGKNTIESMQSGIVYGFSSQVDGMITKMKEELQGDVCVVATGGLAPYIAPECSTIDKVDKYLTLEGLKIIYNKVR